jgi:hypothetical protein
LTLDQIDLWIQPDNFLLFVQAFQRIALKRLPFVQYIDQLRQVACHRDPKILCQLVSCSVVAGSSFVLGTILFQLPAYKVASHRYQTCHKQAFPVASGSSQRFVFVVEVQLG